jgi:uncharacterized protein (DUF488 family)
MAGRDARAGRAPSSRPAAAGDDAPVVHTIGYEGSTLPQVIAALAAARVSLLVDVRAVAMSRRPGFAKTRLAAGLEEAGIAYLHLRALGTPADGRAAARAGRHAEMREIFGRQLLTDAAQHALDDLAHIVRGGTRGALLCFEASPEHCHRTIVADALVARVPATVVHLTPGRDPAVD